MTKKLKLWLFSFSDKINIHLRESINIGLGEALSYRQRNRNELREIKRLIETGEKFEMRDLRREVIQVHLNCLQVFLLYRN